jgi:hypothetical protein
MTPEAQATKEKLGKLEFSKSGNDENHVQVIMVMAIQLVKATGFCTSSVLIS